MTLERDRTILRELANRYMRICHSPVQNVRRRLWRRHNSLKHTRPLIYVRAFAWKEMPQSVTQCESSLFQRYEDFFRRHIFWAGLDDDSIFEPWITLRATYNCQGWGPEVHRKRPTEGRGSWKVDYPIKSLDDIKQLIMPTHDIDEEKTASDYAILAEAVGDIIPVCVDRAPYYRTWAGDISTDLGYLRGIEHFMLDMATNPEWLHRLVKFLADGILKTHDEAEAAGDWGLGCHQNQAMPYAEDLKAPAPQENGVSRSDLWVFMAAQECTGISPAMHDEFILQYQLPILNKFGLVAYGCCEDLTHKIDMLRQIPNLRRIAVSPYANVARCAEQIGTDYVLSYRPSPADMVSYGFCPDRIRAIMTHALEVSRGCHVDVTLKDVETVQSDPERVRKWVALVRSIIDEVYG